MTRVRVIRGIPPGWPKRRRRGWRTAVIALVTALVCAAAVTARLFVWAPAGMPARVDAIVMLNGPGSRLGTALMLARRHRAPVLVISRGWQESVHGGACAPPVPGVQVICFVPHPKTTRGEAEFAGRLAARYHWRSIALVAIRPQNTRARLRVERCFGGSVDTVDAAFPASAWPYEIAYEWAATIKALLVQRSC